MKSSAAKRAGRPVTGPSKAVARGRDSARSAARRTAPGASAAASSHALSTPGKLADTRSTKVASATASVAFAPSLPPTPTPSSISAPSSASAGAGVLVGVLVDSVVEVDRMIARFSALRAELIDTARQAGGHTGSNTQAGLARNGDLAQRSFRAELATALRIPERTAETLIGVSEALTHDLPHTLDALRGGTISYLHAHRIVDAAAILTDPDTRTQFEHAAVAIATGSTTATLTRKLRPLRERLHPETLTSRHTRAMTDREVRTDPGPDGMGWLNAYLPIVDITAIHTRLTDTARSLRDSHETRTLTQLRADILRDILLDDPPTTTTSDTAGGTGGTGGTSASGASGNGVGGGNGGDGGVGVVSRYRGIRPRIYLTVPVLTLLGHDTEPATLEGYGPIDSDTARELTARAPSLTRILTHPETGTILSVGRTKYAIPPDLRTWLRIGDNTCRFPGCNRQATTCDIDHTTDWHTDGPTAHNNLAHLCRLCRCRHKRHYADVGVMPMLMVESLFLLVSGWMLSA